MATETLFVSRLRAVQPLLMPQLGEHKLGLYITAVLPLGESLPKGHGHAFLLQSLREHRPAPLLHRFIRPFWDAYPGVALLHGFFHHER